MIPRTLVPRTLSPAVRESHEPARRLSTYLDDRTLIPPEMPAGPLQTESAIPAHVPLDVLAKRMLVPKDLPPLPPEARAARHAAPTVLDARVAVPKAIEPGRLEISRPLRVEQHRDVLDPDVLSTGEVNLLMRAVEVRPPVFRWQVAGPSALVHAALVVFILTAPKLFPYDPPTQQEIERAHRMLGMVYLPPPEQLPVQPVLPQAPPSEPPPQIRIDPRVFQQYQVDRDIETPGIPGPESATPVPAPRTERELPEAPHAQPALPERSRELARLEPPAGREPESSPGLSLDPRSLSPGRALEESLRGALQGPGGSASTESFEPLPPLPGGGGGQGYVGQALQLLTPTEGVDFTNYLARVLASVRRNWYAVIPESARLGERGIVMLQFRILRDGSVPHPEPSLVRTSGRQPLDRAAISAIRASNPFEPLPAAFSGPFIELRFIFLYNTRLDQ